MLQPFKLKTLCHKKKNDWSHTSYFEQCEAVWLSDLLTLA